MFAPLARRAEALLAGVVLLVVLATGLNALRTPSIVVAAARSRGRSKIAALARLVFPRSAAARAGFDFALATVVAQQDASPDPRGCGGHRIRHGSRRAFRCRPGVRRAADGAAALDSAVAVRDPARRLPPHAARAGGAACQLGHPGGLAGQGASVCERRAGCGAALDCVAGDCCRGCRRLPSREARRSLRLTRCSASPARRSCSTR